jgi:hypothetical protein
MQKALLFFVAVALVVWIAFAKPVEGFTTVPALMGIPVQSMNEGTPESEYTKRYTALPINQPYVVATAEAGVGNIQPSPPEPGTLPSAPVAQRSKETPNPYRDPSLEPAKYIRILGVKEDLQAFFGFQAFILEERNDPSIQIPLTRARADMGDLIDVAAVMERNPGLQSRITNAQLDDIVANLRYLRDILHDLEASGAVQPEALEGFSDLSGASGNFDTGRRATLKELQEFQVKIVVEITRLNASGTTDPVIVGRVMTLNRIKDDVDQVISQLQSGFLTANTVPIFAKDIERALPLLGKPSDPLPQLLKQNNLPPAVANLFPAGLSPRDTETAQQVNNVVQGYMKNLFEGASWGVNVNFKYDNPNVLNKNAQAIKDLMELKKVDAASARKMLETGLPGVLGTGSFAGADVKDLEPTSSGPIRKAPNTGYDSGIPGLSISRTLPEPTTGGFDWKKRSQDIKEAIRRRGLDPLLFGALPDGAVVSNDFSWRGHTQMMCSRLNTTMDPGLGVTVGCPPNNWSGWKN